ncbi:HAMP domain-containing histidine kinase [Patescibacteria group bacterium]|nr:HAMP domain-containing histidine kinase [Patescibacteria group bacterium]
MEEEFGKETLVKERPKLTPEGEAWFSSTGPAEIARQLSGGMLHLLNNKLIPVQGYLELGLLDLPKDVSGKARRDFQTSHEGVRNIVGTLKKVEGLNGVCRIEEYKFLETSANAIVKEAGKFLPDGKEPLKIEISGENGLYVDKENFSFALAGLFTNSLEAGASKVEVGVSKEGGENILEITDNGEGISLSEEEMFGLKSSTREENGGLQLLSTGLFIAKTVVLACGGSIEVHNRKDLGEEESGARVSIRLPAVKNPQKDL